LGSAMYTRPIKPKFNNNNHIHDNDIDKFAFQLMAS